MAASVDLPPHPATYSESVIEKFAEMVGAFDLGGQLALDPFAGLGQKIDQVGMHVIKSELQHGWAKQAHFGAVQADSTNLPFADNTFAAIITSPAYGNRMADKHNAKDGSRRITYKHYLDRTGEKMVDGNSGGMQWTQPAYKELHAKVWAECARVLGPDGIFLLNVSDHIRAGERMFVTRWHLSVLNEIGFKVKLAHLVPTPRMKRGQNHQLRVNGEMVIALGRDNG